jgi:hypothetical protein
MIVTLREIDPGGRTGCIVGGAPARITTRGWTCARSGPERCLVMWTRIRTFLPALALAAFAAFGLVSAGGVAVADDTAVARACDWSSTGDN